MSDIPMTTSAPLPSDLNLDATDVNASLNDSSFNVTDYPLSSADSVESTSLPPHLTFNNDLFVGITAYTVLFVIAAIGNLTVFVSVFRNRHRKSRINLMIMHLAIADLIVTFVMIPLEIGWRITIQWVAGEAACKILLFLRAFGLYLSSMVLVCISLDRYFAILHPLKVNDAQRRGKIMLAFAWIISVVFATPQSVVFHVQSHPDHPNYVQCVSFDFFNTAEQETAYNVVCMMAMYGCPLIIIVFAYTKILWKISMKSKETRDNLSREELYRGRLHLRRSDISNIARARARTLRMTVIIVIAFIWCWTPYFVMTMWYMFDRDSAEKVDPRVQDFLFMFAVSNSCVNPLVYGTYAINIKKECRSCFRYKRRLNVFANSHRAGSGTEAFRTSHESTLPVSIRISATCDPNLVNIRVHATTEGSLLNEIVKCNYYNGDVNPENRNGYDDNVINNHISNNLNPNICAKAM